MFRTFLFSNNKLKSGKTTIIWHILNDVWTLNNYNQQWCDLPQTMKIIFFILHIKQWNFYDHQYWRHVGRWDHQQKLTNNKYEDLNTQIPFSRKHLFSSKYYLHIRSGRLLSFLLFISFWKNIQHKQLTAQLNSLFTEKDKFLISCYLRGKGTQTHIRSNKFI